MKYFFYFFILSIFILKINTSNANIRKSLKWSLNPHNHGTNDKKTSIDRQKQDKKQRTSKQESRPSTEIPVNVKVFINSEAIDLDEISNPHNDQLKAFIKYDPDGTEKLVDAISFLIDLKNDPSKYINVPRVRSLDIEVKIVDISYLSSIGGDNKIDDIGIRLNLTTTSSKYPKIPVVTSATTRIFRHEKSVKEDISYLLKTINSIPEIMESISDKKQDQKKKNEEFFRLLKILGSKDTNPKQKDDAFLNNC